MHKIKNMIVIIGGSVGIIYFFSQNTLSLEEKESYKSSFSGGPRELDLNAWCDNLIPYEPF